MVRNCYKEIFKLKDMMDKAKIPYTFKNGYLNGGLLMYPNKENVVCSAIEHDGSYGREEDMIEIKGLLTDEERKYDEVVGWLSADEVFARIAKHWNSQINAIKE